VGVAAHTDRLRREADRANRGEALADANYRAAREALRQMLKSLDDRGRADIPAVKELRRDQAETALTFFLAVAGQQDDRPEVRHDAARAALDAAHLQSLLSRPSDAEVNLRRAVDQLSALAAEFPDVADYRAGRARGLNDLGELLRAGGRYDEALRCHAEALTLRQRLLPDDPASPIVREDLATSHHNLGNTYGGIRESADSERHYRAAIELREKLVAESPQQREYRRRLAETQVGLSVLLQLAPSGRAGAQVAHDQADGHFEQLLRADPNDFESASSLATLRLNWAYVLANEGQTDEALADLAKNVVALERILKQEPNDASARVALYRTYGTRAQILTKVNRHAEAAADWERVVTQCPSAERKYNRLFLAEALARAGDHGRAIAATEESVAALPVKPAWEQLYHLAGVCGLALTAIEADNTLTSDVRDERMTHATKLCLELLGKTRAVLGSEKWLELREGLATETKFATLRKQAGFRELLKPK
jgi:tetratricopeptide (TPR) repeat protein